MKKIISALLGVMLLASPVMAAKKIMFSPGGGIVEFIEQYNDLRESEGKLVIDGTCISACTLFLGLVPKDSVCATPFGLLGFHSASVYNPLTGERHHSKTGTQLIWNYYPKIVRDALISKGWDVNPLVPQLEEHPEIIYFPATDFVKACDAPLAR